MSSITLSVVKAMRSLTGSRSTDFCSAGSKQLMQSRTSVSMLKFSLGNIGRLVLKQVNCHWATRRQRANQLYIKLQRTALLQPDVFILSVLRRLRKRSPWLLLGTAGFNFKEQGISDEDVRKCIKEFQILKPPTRKPVDPRGTTSAKCNCGWNKLNAERFGQHLREEGYEMVVDSDTLHIYRKSQPDLANYKYKVWGTFQDIPARAFFAVQCDTDYRKNWDKLVVNLNIVAHDSNNEVIYWQMHYPFPMSSRDYVFIRRNLIDEESGCMVVVSHSTQHPDCPPRKGVVRVDQYMSNMVISPHKTFDENGFDYLLTYYDDPHSSFPSPVYAWMAASGVHDYMDKLHRATKVFHEGSKASCSAQCSTLSEVQHLAPVQLQQAA